MYTLISTLEGFSLLAFFFFSLSLVPVLVSFHFVA